MPCSTMWCAAHDRPAAADRGARARAPSGRRLVPRDLAGTGAAGRPRLGDGDPVPARAGRSSHWHKVDATEFWLFHAGTALDPADRAGDPPGRPFGSAATSSPASSRSSGSLRANGSRRRPKTAGPWSPVSSRRASTSPASPWRRRDGRPGVTGSNRVRARPRVVPGQQAAWGRLRSLAYGQLTFLVNPRLYLRERAGRVDYLQLRFRTGERGPDPVGMRRTGDDDEVDPFELPLGDSRGYSLDFRGQASNVGRTDRPEVVIYPGRLRKRFLEPFQRGFEVGGTGRTRSAVPAVGGSSSDHLVRYWVSLR